MDSLFGFLKEIYPIHRRLMGKEVRETLSILKRELPSLSLHFVPSNTKVFDWAVPMEWSVDKVVLEDREGKVLADLDNNFLHVMGYSAPFFGNISKSEFNTRVISVPSQPKAIPYVNSYYQYSSSVFCVKDEDIQDISFPLKGEIRSYFSDGYLDYADLIIKGKSKKEIMFSTYICHPNIANELSGIVLQVALAQWIQQQSRYYTYRFVFIPETIGSLIYLLENRFFLKDRLKAGFTLTCLSHGANFSIISSRLENTHADVVSRRVIKNGKMYSYLDRGSDERNYGFPNIDLPVVGLTRTKYGRYSEYHTSLDNLDFISPILLDQSLDMLKNLVEEIEDDTEYYIVDSIGEPCLCRRNLIPRRSFKNISDYNKKVRNVMVYCDGNHSVSDIADKLQISVEEVRNIIVALGYQKL